jgi:dUTP pyrophosphatase
MTIKTMTIKTVELKWKKLHPKAELPKVATAGAACFDLRASMDAPMTLNPGDIVLVPTGLAVEIPLGFEMQLRARSGLAAKYGFALVNGIGTIDADYRGEIKAISIVLGKEPLTIYPGDRICQALIAPVIPVIHHEVNELTSTDRGVGGMGSTGVST